MSLLAFQDIITSVSGILMFIVLMLSLELSNEAAAPETPVVDAADLEQLEAAVAEARKRKTTLEGMLGASDDLARAAAAVAPEQLRAELRDLDLKIEDLQRSNRSLEARRDTLLADKRSAASETADSAADQTATEQALKEASRLALEISNVKSDDRPVFSLPRGFSKSGWLVVVSKDRCEVAPLGRRASPRSFPVSSGLLSAASDVSPFLAWSKSLDADAYFLLIVRPGAAAAFEAIKDDFATRKVSFGYDVAGPNRKLLDPDRGAFQ